jgi:predicted DNA-binding ribbon-helix-helix protein
VAIEAFTAIATECLPGNHYTLIRLYRKACEHLEAKVAGEWAAFEAEANARLSKDLERIEEYYKGLARETLDPLRKVFRRMASLSVRSQLARSSDIQSKYSSQLHSMKQEASSLENRYDVELQQLAAEKERHCSELIAKHQTRAEIHLTNLAALRVPRVEYTIRMNGPARREITLLYDMLRERIVDFNCEACGQRLHEAQLCACGDLVCSDCAATCACGKQICTGCAAGSCHVCGGLVCGECMQIGCPLEIAAQDGLAVCSNCRQDACPECSRSASAVAE